PAGFFEFDCELNKNSRTWQRACHSGEHPIMPITRRHFLQSTGLAASTLGLTGAAGVAAQEPAKPVSPNDHVQIGCIGFGIMGQGDMHTASSLPGVQLVAVSDVYDGRRTLAQESYGKDVFTTRDYRELLARRDRDAITLA